MKRLFSFRNGLLATIWLVFTINMLDRGITTTLLPVIRKDLNISIFMMGLATSSFFVTIIIGNLFGGYIAGRFGGRAVLRIITLVFTIITALTGFVHSAVQLIAVRMGLGLAEAPDLSSSLGLIARWFNRRERGKATAVMATAAVVGGMLPVAVAIPLTNAFHGNWRYVFYLMLIPGLLAAAAVWGYVFDSPEQARAKGRISQHEYDEISSKLTSAAAGELLTLERSEPADRAEIAGRSVNRQMVGRLLKDKSFWFYTMAVFSHLSLGVGFGLWQSTYLIEGLHFSLGEMGLISLLPALFSFAGIFLFGWVLDRYPALPVRLILFTSFILTAAAFVMLSQVRSQSQFLLLGLGLSFIGLFMSACQVPINLYVQKRFPAHMVSTVYGMVNGIAQIGGTFLIPVIAGALIVNTGTGLNFTGVFILFISVAAAGALFSLLLSEQKSEARAAAAPLPAQLS